MSATGRGAVRVENDYYATPAWAVDAVLPHLPLYGATVLDPCCGDGAILRQIATRNVPAHGIEIDPARAALAAPHAASPIVVADALDPSVAWPSCSVVVTNPPYKLALEFVQRAISHAPVVAMLLRLNWLAGQRRAAFHHEHPSDVLVLSKRPSFSGGPTDATDYAWLIWGLGGGRWRIA